MKKIHGVGGEKVCKSFNWCGQPSVGYFFQNVIVNTAFPLAIFVFGFLTFHETQCWLQILDNRHAKCQKYSHRKLNKPRCMVIWIVQKHELCIVWKPSFIETS